jgi:hypothetical protein
VLLATQNVSVGAYFANLLTINYKERRMMIVWFKIIFARNKSTEKPKAIY